MYLLEVCNPLTQFLSYAGPAPRDAVSGGRAARAAGVASVPQPLPCPLLARLHRLPPPDCQPPCRGRTSQGRTIHTAHAY